MMTTTGNRSGVPVTGWHVTSQQETTQLGPNGKFTRGFEVTFQMETGTSGTVFVPKAMYTPENVRAAILGWAERLQAIGGLSG